MGDYVAGNAMKAWNILLTNLTGKLWPRHPAIRYITDEVGGGTVDGDRIDAKITMVAMCGNIRKTRRFVMACQLNICFSRKILTAQVVVVFREQKPATESLPG